MRFLSALAALLVLAFAGSAARACSFMSAPAVAYAMPQVAVCPQAVAVPQAAVCPQAAFEQPLAVQSLAQPFAAGSYGGFGVGAFDPFAAGGYGLSPFGLGGFNAFDQFDGRIFRGRGIGFRGHRHGHHVRRVGANGRGVRRAINRGRNVRARGVGARGRGRGIAARGVRRAGGRRR